VTHRHADKVIIEAPGTYAIRQVKGGPEVGCLVEHGPSCDPVTGETLDRSWMHRVTINGDLVHCSPDVYHRMLIGRPITRAEYDWLIADRAWAAQFAPGLPEARPRQRVNIDALPIPF